MERRETDIDQIPGIPPQSENLIIPPEQTLDPTPTERSSFWQDGEGNWLPQIIEKDEQIRHGRY